MIYFKGGIKLETDSAFDGMLQILRPVFQATLNGVRPAHSFEELYRAAHTLVLHRKSDRLYTEVQLAVREHLTEKASYTTLK
jgi:hypothetical protein